MRKSKVGPHEYGVIQPGVARGCSAPKIRPRVLDLSNQVSLVDVADATGSRSEASVASPTP